MAPSATGPQPAAQAAVAAVAPKANWDGLVIASAVYISGYFLIGIAAIIAWVHADTNTPDLVKNLALIAIGLFVAIIRQFLNVPPPG